MDFIEKLKEIISDGRGSKQNMHDKSKFTMHKYTLELVANVTHKSYVPYYKHRINKKSNDRAKTKPKNNLKNYLQKFLHNQKFLQI